MTIGNILVLGGAHVDRRGRIHGETAPGASNPGSWFVEAGGGAFNAARNLSRLGHAVRLIAPRGGDSDGEIVAAAALAAGIDDTPFTFLDRATPSYTAIIERDGNLVIALADMDLYRLFSPRRLQQRAVREAFKQADAIITDANLPEETITAIGEASRTNDKPLFGIAISPAKVIRFLEALPALDCLFMNEAEARALTGTRADEPRLWPELLRSKGLRSGVVTRGRDAAVAFDATGAVTLAPPMLEALGDVTGAGDALASGFLSARLTGRPLALCLRHGVAAALIAVRSPLAVAEELEPDLLARIITLVPEAEMLS